MGLRNPDGTDRTRRRKIASKTRHYTGINRIFLIHLNIFAINDLIRTLKNLRARLGEWSTFRFTGRLSRPRTLKKVDPVWFRVNFWELSVIGPNLFTILRGKNHYRLKSHTFIIFVYATRFSRNHVVSKTYPNGYFKRISLSKNVR